MLREIKDLMNKKGGGTKILFLLGAAGALMILLSEFIPDRTKTNEETGAYAANAAEDDVSAYQKQLEKELCEILSQLEGVSNVKVMISVTGTREYVYAEQNELEQKTDSQSESIKRQGEIIIADQEDGKQPVLKKIKSPEIGGAAIVCTGAADPTVKERVINTASAALGLSTGRISVEEYG